MMANSLQLDVDRFITEKPDISTGLPHLTTSGAITGDSIMKYIELTKGYRAIVDDEDFDWLNQWQWCVQRDIRSALISLFSLFSSSSCTSKSGQDAHRMPKACLSFSIHRLHLSVIIPPPALQ